MKIGILGTHGVGKTTIASQFFTYCISKGKNARIIHEIVRDCPFGIHDEQTIDTVSWIITKQVAAELDAKAKKPDIIICDRTAVDPMMYLYAKVGVKLDEYGQNLSDFAHSWLETYDILVYVKPFNTPITPDGFRNTDSSFQKAVDAEFAITMSDIMNKYPSQQVFILNSNVIFQTDLNHFFENLLGGNK